MGDGRPTTLSVPYTQATVPPSAFCAPSGGESSCTTGWVVTLPKDEPSPVVSEEGVWHAKLLRVLVSSGYDGPVWFGFTIVWKE